MDLYNEWGCFIFAVFKIKYDEEKSNNTVR